MIEKIDRIFIIQILLFAVLILLVFTLFFIRISVNNIEKELDSEFVSELYVKANDLNYRITLARENVKALSSRSMLRTRLNDYYCRNMSLDEIRIFSQDKFIEGALVYSNLLYAQRFGFNDAMIAEYIVSEPGSEINNTDSLVFFETEQGANLLLRNQIIFNDMVIGTDVVAFFIDDFEKERFGRLKMLHVADETMADTAVLEGFRSAPIGDTGYYLLAQQDPKILKDARRGVIRTVMANTMLLFVSIIVISYFTILRMTRRLINDQHEANHQLGKSLKERELLFRELNHRVKNNLNFIISYIDLQQCENHDEELKARNEQLVRKIEAISLTYEMLQDDQQFSGLDVGRYLSQLCRSIVESGSTGEVKLESSFPDEIAAKTETVITLGLIYSEFVTNSLKYALTADLLTIRYGVRRSAGNLVFFYEDDGLPYPDNFDPEESTSLGFLILKSLTHQLGGRFVFDPRKSKRIEIILPDD